MIRALLLILISVLAFACKSTKTLEEVVVTPGEEVVEPEEVVEDTRVLQRVNMDPYYPTNCKELWKNKERLILEKDDERLKKLIARGTGKITMIVKVNLEGEVIDVTIDDKNTTLKESILRGYARETVLGYIFEPMAEGPKADCGTIAWSLDEI